MDAVYVKDVRGAEVAHLLGAQSVFELGFHPDPFIRISNCAPRPLTVNVETIDQRPDLVARLLKQVVKAGEWAKKNPDETSVLVARETGWSESWIKRAFGEKLHLNLGLTLHEESIAGINTFKDFLFEFGFLKQNFDVFEWMDYRPFEAIKAEVISIA